jgi:CDP-paratose 2-epimerase
MRSPPFDNLPLRDRFGMCQWFHFEDRRSVERTIELLADLGVHHLRTGISWADSHLPGAKRWFDWQMDQLHRAGLKVLLSVWHTPPSISEDGTCNAPPKRLRDYADFIDRVITDYAGTFDALELWNEPNNKYKWNFVDRDPQWRKFGRMLVDAGSWARHRGQVTVLGGMIPVDPHWLDLMQSHGVLDHVDVVAIHAFPGMWWPGQANWDWHARWQGWEAKLDCVRDAARDRPIWVTETGLATWCLATHREAKWDLQVKMLEDATAAPAQRVYWYSLIDLDPQREAIEGFHVDENEYHMGLVAHAGVKKDAYFRLRELLAEPKRAPKRATARRTARKADTPPATLGLH